MLPLLLLLASFDCTKATTTVEKTICASPRLSALNDELAATYAAARKLGNGAARRDQQRTWMAKSRNECDESPGCIEAAYLTRIAALRLANRDALFARQNAPARIAGRYSEEQQNCHPSEDDPNDNVCDGSIENFVDIRRAAGNAVIVNSELYFYMGHMCTIENAPAEWVRDELRVSIVHEEVEQCVLVLRFDENVLTMSDPARRCKDLSCGVRGGFDDFSLEKRARKTPSRKR